MSSGVAGQEFMGHEPLAYEKLKNFEGRVAATEAEGLDPVNAPMIRHWCEAMGDTNPAYEGPDAIAPPTMLQAWTMAGLAGYEGRSPPTTSCSRSWRGPGTPRSSPPTASRSICGRCGPVT